MKRIISILCIGLALAACTAEKEKEAPKTSDPSKAPQVTATSPSNNEAQAAIVDEITITYDKPIQLVERTTISVNDVYYDEVVYAEGNTLHIPVSLRGGTTYTVKVTSPSVKDSEGNFSGSFSFSFTTLTRNNFDASRFSLAQAPVDPSATDEAKALYAELLSYFGTKTCSAAMAEVNWNYDNAKAIFGMAGKYPYINAFDYINLPQSPSSWIDYSDITPVSEWVSKGGVAAAGWHWSVPVADPNQAPEPDFEDDEVIDFDDVDTGSWTGYYVLDASYFVNCVEGSMIKIYYRNAAEGALMALKDPGSEGWPGLVDANGTSYEYFEITAGRGYYTLLVDAPILAVIQANGMVVGGRDYIIRAVGINHPGSGIEYDETRIDINVDTGSWSGYKVLDAALFTGLTIDSQIKVHYSAANSALMAFKNPGLAGWPGLVDANGTSYEYFDIADGTGTYTLEMDEVLLEAIKANGMVVGGRDYTIDYVIIAIPASKEEVEYDDTVLDMNNTDCGNWAGYQVVEATNFAECVVGSKLVVHYTGASDALMAFKDPGSEGWPGLVDSNGTSYEYFAIPGGEGDYTLNVDEAILPVIQANGMVIGGKNYTIVSLTVRNPKLEKSFIRRIILHESAAADVEYAFYAEGNEFNPADALTDGNWQNDIIKEDLAELASYLLLLQDAGIPVLFRPLHEASGGWFWWGSRSGEEFVALWKYVFEYMAGAGVHNLLWVWTSCLDDTSWYPGDDYVDIIAYDWYPQDEAAFHGSGIQAWNNLLTISNKKMLALGECGAMPSVGECLEDGCMWIWWMPWYGDFMAAPYNSAADFKSWILSPYVVSGSATE